MAQTTTNTITPTDVFFPPLFGYQIWDSVTQPGAKPAQSIYQKSIVLKISTSGNEISVPFGPAAPGWGNPMSQIAGVLATKVQQAIEGNTASFPELILTAACNTRCSLLIPIGPPPSGDIVDDNVGYQTFTLIGDAIFQPPNSGDARIIGGAAFDAFRVELATELPSRTTGPTSQAAWIYSAISTPPPLTAQNLDSSYGLVTATVLAGSGTAPDYTITNANTQGVGVFDGNNGPTNFRFRGVAEGTGIDVVLDVPSKAIVVSLDADLNDLNDVVITAPPTIGDVVTYDGTNWVNQPGTGNTLAGLTDVQMSSLPTPAPGYLDEALTYDAPIGRWTNKQVLQLHQWRFGGSTGIPSDGEFILGGNIDPVLATTLMVSKVDHVNRDSQAWLSAAFVFGGNQSLVIETYGNRLLYDITGVVSDVGTYWNFPVINVGQTGTTSEPTISQVCIFSTVSNATVSAVTSGSNVGGVGYGFYKQVFGGVMEFYNIYTAAGSGLSSVLIAGPGDDYVAISLDADIDQLNDVDTTSSAPTNGQVLTWDSGTSKWIPQSLPSGPQSNTTAIVDPTVTDDSSLGYSVGSTWLNTVTGQWWKCSDATVGAAVWKQDTITIKNNSAATSPAVTDDSTAGYSVGSEWLDTTTSQWWKCVSAAVGAAVWRIDTDDYKANSVRISHGSTIDSAVVNAVVIGHGAGIISGNQTVCVGHDATVNGARAVAVGSTTSGGAIDTVVVGYGAVASASHGTAIGALAQSQGNGRIAIGAGAVTTATERLALGFNGNNNVSVGTQFSRLPVAIDGTAYQVCMRDTDLAFDDLSDVVITSAKTGNSVIYNGTNYINEPNVFYSPYPAPQCIAGQFSPGGTPAAIFLTFQVPRTAVYSSAGIWINAAAGGASRMRLGIYNGDPTTTGTLIDQTALISGTAIGTTPISWSSYALGAPITLTANVNYTFAIAWANVQLGTVVGGFNLANYGRGAGTTDYYTGGFPASLNLVAWSGSSAARYAFRLS